MFRPVCEHCGHPLVLHSYVLAYHLKRPRICQANVPIEEDGFCVCDDLRGTKYEYLDQSTDQEKTRCTGCGRIDGLQQVIRLEGTGNDGREILGSWRTTVEAAEDTMMKVMAQYPGITAWGFWE